VQQPLVISSYLLNALPNRKYNDAFSLGIFLKFEKRPLSRLWRFGTILSQLQLTGASDYGKIGSEKQIRQKSGGDRMSTSNSNHGATINKEEIIPEESFPEWFKSKQQSLTNKDGSKISTEEIGLMIGLNYSTFRKFIYNQRTTKKRDFIIAVCAVMGCDRDDTNKALKLYGFPELDEYYRRDEIIWDLLVANPGTPVSVAQINEALDAGGYSPLDIHNHRNKEQTQDKPQVPFKLVRRHFQCTIEGIGRSSDTDSFLDLLYDVDCYYNMRTCFEYLSGGRRFELCIQHEEPHSDLSENIWQTGIRRRICPKRKKYIVYTYPTEEQESELYEYDRIDDTGAFRECFLEIEKKEREEKKRLCDTVNDTRNYGSRISAKVIDSELHIFCEMYNSDIPELSEYYLMDFCGGEYTLYVLKQSCFMQMDLSAEKYEQIYGKLPAFRLLHIRKTMDDAFCTKADLLNAPVLDRYSSEEEIEDSAYEARDIGTFETYGENAITKLRLKTYRKMKAQIDDMMSKLKTGTAHICNRELLCDAADRLIAAYFGLPDIENNEAGYSAAQFQDAFELGLRTVDEIGAFLQKNGSLKINEVLSLQESEGAESYV